MHDEPARVPNDVDAMLFRGIDEALLGKGVCRLANQRLE
jgi:hypothetical protein